MSEMDVRGEELPSSAEIAIETPEADAVEQQRSLRLEDDDLPAEVPFGVDPADAGDQKRSVPQDEDDYR
ncbi:hypothetical protein [Rhizohabitans arisaemae]|uniref:hypothetical protein n=1 Tax=Rhizohabitans arisaemae TaxID=2720610 RepID=UPI0024B17028|nr:hypothetical protein [Rhizohabitans arisaemae]